MGQKLALPGSDANNDASAVAAMRVERPAIGEQASGAGRGHLASGLLCAPSRTSRLNPKQPKNDSDAAAFAPLPQTPKKGSVIPTLFSVTCLAEAFNLFNSFLMGDEVDVKGGQPWRFDIRIVSLDDLPHDVEGVAVLWAKGEVRTFLPLLHNFPFFVF